MIRKLILLVCIFSLTCVYQVINAQEEEEIIEEEVIEEQDIEQKVINLTQLYTLLFEDSNEVIISDFIITPDKNDNKFLIDKIFFSSYEVDLDGISADKIYFYNCSFNSSNETPITITNFGNILKLNIIGSEFLCPFTLSMITNSGNYPVIIENCNFANDFNFENGNNHQIKNLKISKNNFAACTYLNPNAETLNINNNSFIADTIEFKNRDYEKTYYQLTLGYNHSYGNVKLSHNKFNNYSQENIFSATIASAEIQELQLDFNHMYALNLSGADVEKSLLVDSLNVEKYIGILNFDFPENNTNISWFNLSGEKLAIFHFDDNNQLEIYQAKTNSELSNNLLYNDLMSSYAKLNKSYHERGDIESANNSYIEIKDIETRRQAYIQTVNPTFNNYLNYNLNRFLRFFSDYATNPGKSLIQSIWVILFFTILYVFTFYRWDGMNLKYFVEQVDRFTDYISNEKTIKEAFERKQNVIEKDLEELRDKYLVSDRKMPKLMYLFSNPLVFLGRLRFNILPNLIRTFDFQQEAWDNLSFWKKAKSGTIITCISVIFIIYVIFVKLVNSLFLSLNSFIVLGFGALPEEEEGLAMYLTIIEGIIGWFLLTIFTITLFSQVLQST